VRIDITIPANGKWQDHNRGKYFYCVSTTDVYTVQPDFGGPHTVNSPGARFGSDAQKFNFLTFVNATGTDISTTIEVSNTPILAADASAATGAQSNTAGRATTKQFLVTIPAGGLVALSQTDLWFTGATVYGLKSLSGTPNGNNVQLGVSSQANQQPKLIAPSDEVSFNAPAGQQRNLANFFISGVAGDGVVVIYS
jgi:hypothetical protein